MAPSVPNPNWPNLYAEGAFGVNPFFTPNAQSTFTDLTPRLYKGWSVRRGKQFELDTVQPGEWHGYWVNQDGFLDPTNTTTPYQPSLVPFISGVLPYRGFRMRTQYPPTVNALNGDQATGGELTPLATGTNGIGSGVLGINSFFVTASATAWQGTQVWQATGTTATNNTIFFTNAIPIIANVGTTYTFSIRVRSVTTGANPVVNLGVAWQNVTGNPAGQSTTGNTTLTGSPTAAWTTLTYTVSVPGPSSGLYPIAAQWYMQLPTSPAGTWSFQVDGLQMEQNTSASTFVIPGTAYPVYSGTIERYPQTWEFTGTYGMVTPVCVDTMALLSQTILQEAFVNEVVPTGPQWFYLLNESGSSNTFAEQGGRAGNGVIATVGTGSASGGSPVNSATPAGKFYGTNGPVVTFGNSTANQGVFVDLTPGLTAGPGVGPPTGTGWTRMFAFRSNSGTNATICEINSGNSASSAFDLTSTNKIVFTYQGATGVNFSFISGGVTSATLTNSTVVNDNNWHLVFFTLASDGVTARLYVDGSTAGSTFGSAVPTTGYVTDAAGGGFYGLNYGADANNFVGDFGLYAQWNLVLSGTNITNLYNAWLTAGRGETSDQRYSRILRYANYQGSSNLDLGVSAMGPCNDINGLDALTCLQNVVNTEGGRHFVDRSGTITFQSRQRAFTSNTPVWTFGENTAGGEIPYDNLAFDFDPTHVSNAVIVTHELTSTVYTTGDTTSQQNYGTRTFTRTSQANDPNEAQQSAYFYLSRYKDPHLRVQALRINVAANPTLFPTVLQFELGQRVRMNRRDPFGVRPIITQDGFIEQITHTGDDAATWVTDLQVSPIINTTNYAVFTALSTTLNVAASSGATTITINALPDAATNPVRSEIAQGQILQVGSGATLEQVTVQSVQNQAAGYTTAVITLTTGLLNSHLINEQVIESPGVTYDPFAVFDTVLFAY